MAPNIAVRSSILDPRPSTLDPRSSLFTASQIAYYLSVAKSGGARRLHLSITIEGVY